IPAFDGLLPEPHNGRLLKLLFEFAHLHGLAKLEMHTDTTLDVLSEVVRERFADAVNDFQVNTCSQFQTLELEREKSARLRHEEKKANSSKANKPTGQESLSDNASDPARQKSRSDTARKEKGWNVNTYKFHRLGDYVSTIRNMGVTGSYSTQRVSAVSFA
ncbi:hypothetical protein BV25DRAFT_1817305, partial [Artomyces pyxidatus]